MFPTVLTSDQAASRIAQGQQGALLNMALAQQMNSFASNPGAEAVAAGGLNMMQSAGVPLLSGMMGMAGLDPLSMGFNAGAMAFRGGMGLAGSSAIGMGVAAPMMMAGMGMHYGMNQMSIGAGHQQALNGMLRQNFHHQGQSGTGFDRSQMSQIGGAMREMTHNFGASGEVVGMGELTRLAGQMSGMGMMRGVRDVKEFSEKFKGMVDALKTMAKDLGTSLEGALQFSNEMRGSGVFKVADQAKFAAQARNMSLSGNVAMTEITSMASIGSQVSRSVGGLGQQGAFAGMRAIGNLGTAMQIGAIKEEDIYNATGLGGAAGRQAYASSMLQRDASFLQSGRGRYFMAQMANKNGQIDESVAQEFLSGGMDVERTRGLAGDHLGKTGRANFLRNEGRLRGSILERFGGNVNAMSLMGWASGKGVDINSMDDRSMIFAQRQLGMGRDDFEVALKQAQALPEIMKAQADTQEKDGYLKKVADQKKTTGIEGLQRRFTQAKEGLNSKLQQIGANILNEGSNYVERFMNQVADIYEKDTWQDADQAWRRTMSGSGGSSIAFQRAFGGRGGGAGSRSGGTTSGAFFSKGALDGILPGGGSAADRYQSAGWGFGDLEGNDKGISDRLAMIRGVGNAAQRSVGSELAGMTGGMGDSFLAHAANLGGAKGERYLQGVGNYVKKQGGALAERWGSADAAGQAEIARALSDRAGLGSDFTYNALKGAEGPGLSSGSGRTQMDIDRTWAGVAGYTEESDEKKANRVVRGTLVGANAGALAGATVGAFFGGIGAAPGAAIGAAAGGILGLGVGTYESYFHKDEDALGVGRALRGEAFRNRTMGLMGGGYGDPKDIQREILKEQAVLGQKGELHGGEYAQYTTNALSLGVAALGNSGKSGDDLRAEAEKIVKGNAGLRMLAERTGKDGADLLLGAFQQIGTEWDKKATATRQEQADMMSTVAGEKLGLLDQAGLATVGKDGKIVLGEGAKGLSAEAREVIEAGANYSRVTGNMNASDVGAWNAQTEEAKGAHQKMLTGSVSGMREAAQALMMAGDGSGAAKLQYFASGRQRIDKRMARAGGGGLGIADVMSNQLGLSLDRKTLSAIGGIGDRGQMTDAILGQLEASGVSLSKEERAEAKTYLKEAANGLASKDGRAHAKGVNQLLTFNSDTGVGQKIAAAKDANDPQKATVALNKAFDKYSAAVVPAIKDMAKDIAAMRTKAAPDVGDGTDTKAAYGK